MESNQAPPDIELDRVWMQRALDLARLGKGLVEPNPMVGCASSSAMVSASQKDSTNGLVGPMLKWRPFALYHPLTYTMRRST